MFDEFDVGVATLHLDACIAALESRINKARSGEGPLNRKPVPGAAVKFPADS